MSRASVKPALLDIFSGVIAIVAVVGAGIVAQSIGNDFRGLYAMTAGAFFIAGVVRGKNQPGRLAWRVMRVSVGGLLGTAALVLNNGPHLLSIQAGLVLTGVAFSFAGLLARRYWHSDPAFSICFSAVSLFIAGWVVVAAVPVLSGYSAFEQVHRPLPAFELQANNHILHSEELKGHVVVLAFWASWCLQCLDELPELQQVYARYRNDPEVVFLAVDTGWAGETPEMGQRRLAQRHLDLPMAFDPGPAAESLGVDAIPALILVDRNGNEQLIHRGYDRSEHLRQSLTREIEKLR